MSFDEFFVNGDKPYAENLNDSVLLANALEFKVIVSAPSDFSTGTFIDTTSARKCGVCTIRLKETLPTGVTVTGDGYLSFTGENTVQFCVYPNFNQFGKWNSICWTCTDTGTTTNIKVDLLTKLGDVIVEDITNGGQLSSDVELSKLDEIIVQIRSTDDCILDNLEFTFNKKINTSIPESSVRILGYSTTVEMNAAILAAVVDKVTSDEVEEIVHSVLQEVFTGRTALVSVENGELVVKTFEEEDL